MESHPVFSALAEAVADGVDPDWTAASASALSDADRQCIEQLRAVSLLGRRFATATTDGSLASLSAPDAVRGAATAADREVPRTWGPLQIRERVGRGRFGDVYRAWDPAIHREVALKLLRRRTGRAGAPESELVQEGRLMARVRHPNVVTIYGAAHHDGRTGLWMEFIEGRTLAQELQDRGPFPGDEVARIGIELSRALGAVHDAGLVHRDVKAQNVMREVTGRVVLGDFGTGLDADDEPGSALAGTPVYLAPEIFQHLPARPQSDIYSLGVLLFHLATGTYPVTGRTIADITRAHTTRARTSIRGAAPQIPAPVADVIDRALEPEPSQRFVSIVEMEHHLANALVPQHVPSVDEGGPSSRRVASAVLVMAGVILIASAFLSPASIRDWWSGRSPSGRASGQVAAEAHTPQLSRVPAPQFMFLGRPSPDGRVFSMTDLDGDLAVFDVATGAQRKLTERSRDGGTAYVSAPFSSDGESIAYSWETKDGWELRVMPAAGGPARVVLASGTVIPHPLQWSQDGQALLMLFEPHDGQRRLALTTLADGSTRDLAGVDAGHTGASLSPDGRWVVFDHGQSDITFERDVSIVAVDAPGQAARLVSSDRDDYGPRWTPDGAGVIFVSNRTSEPSVWTVNVHNGAAVGEPVIRHRNIGRATPLALTADGTLFYNLVVGLVDVSVATLDLATGRVLETPRPVTPSDVGSNITSSWSRDGRYLACVTLPQVGSVAGEARRISIVDTATGEIRRLAPRLGFYQFPRWSPDGRTLAVKGYDLQLREGLYLVDVETGETRTAVLSNAREPVGIGPFAWGTDERTLLFTRFDRGLMTLDLVTNEERSVFTFASEGIRTFQPNGFRLSRDGQSIVYVAYRRSARGTDETVLRIKTRGQPTRDLFVGNVGVGDLVNGDTEILVPRPARDTQDPRDMSLWLVPVAGGDPRPIDLTRLGLRDVSVHPDGRQITFTSGFPGADLWRLAGFLTR